MKVCFAILAHDHPEIVSRLARRLLDANGVVAIHYDAKRGDEPVEEIRSSLADVSDRVVWAQRVSVAWGEWSMIEATLNTVKALYGAGHEPDYVHLMSASDYPIRPLQEFRDFLKRNRGKDFIESYDIADKKWVRDGLSRERYQYRHFFNFKKHPKLFGMSWKIQHFLGLARKLPSGVRIHMGSQWCTLTGESWKHILKRAESKDIGIFFSRTWIPDEMFMQSMLADANRPHSNRHLTLYQFTGYGVPVVYYDGHTEHLARQPFFFARKLSPYANVLRGELDRLLDGKRALPRLDDSDIGALNDDYENFQTLHRKGLTGKRTIGLVRDEWQGDLEWNRKHYIAFLGMGREELSHIARMMGNLPGFIGHGALFAKDRIHFAGEHGRLAGYATKDIGLRDHRRTTFLTDVISQFPDDVTAFTLSPDEERDIFHQLRYDKRSFFVLVRGNIIRSFLELGFRKFSKISRRIDTGAGESLQADPLVFRQFYDRYETYYSNRKKQLVEAGARFTEIDINQPGWQYALAKFLYLLDNSEQHRRPYLGAVVEASSIDGISDPFEIIANADELAQLIPDSSLRVQHMKPRLSPYLVMLGDSFEETDFVAEALNESGQFNIRDEPAFRAPGLLDLAKLGEYHGAGSGIYFGGIPHPEKMNLVSSDPNARFVIVKGNVLRAVRDRHDAKKAEAARAPPTSKSDVSLPSFNPLEFQIAYEHFRLSNAGDWFAGQARPAVLFVTDLMRAEWREELCGFLKNAFAGIDGLKVRKSLESKRFKERLVALCDPSAVFSNADLLCTLIPDDAQRRSHQSNSKMVAPAAKSGRTGLPSPENGGPVQLVPEKRNRPAENA